MWRRGWPNISGRMTEKGSVGRDIPALKTMSTCRRGYSEPPSLADSAAGGRVDRFIGDAVMVTFNVSVDRPHHALRAARAALNFQDAARLVGNPSSVMAEGPVRGLTPVPPSPVWSAMGDNGPRPCPRRT